MRLIWILIGVGLLNAVLSSLAVRQLEWLYADRGGLALVRAEAELAMRAALLALLLLVVMGIKVHTLAVKVARLNDRLSER